MIRLAADRLIANAGWLIGGDPQPALAVFLIGLPVAFEPLNMAITLKGEDVRCDAVKEPAVVGDHNRASCKFEQGFLKRTQRVNVQIVGRLIKQQQVAAGFEHPRQMNTVAFTA